MASLSRRTAVKVIASGSTLLGVNPQPQASAQPLFKSDEPAVIGGWDRKHDRVWLGEDVWANPMEDWRIIDGAAECRTTGGDRNIQAITRQITN